MIYTEEDLVNFLNNNDIPYIFLRSPEGTEVYEETRSFLDRLKKCEQVAIYGKTFDDKNWRLILKENKTNFQMLKDKVKNLELEINNINYEIDQIKGKIDA